jgi:hypothetical protein
MQKPTTKPFTYHISFLLTPLKNGSSVKINTEEKYVTKINSRSETPNYKILPFIVRDLLSIFLGLLQFPNNENRPPLRGRTGVPLTCLQTK